jgi:hypothetical protein
LKLKSRAIAIVSYLQQLSIFTDTSSQPAMTSVPAPSSSGGGGVDYENVASAVTFAVLVVQSATLTLIVYLSLGYKCTRYRNLGYVGIGLFEILVLLLGTVLNFAYANDELMRPLSTLGRWMALTASPVFVYAFYSWFLMRSRRRAASEDHTARSMTRGT